MGRCLLYGQTIKQRNKNINNFIFFHARAQAFSQLLMSLVSSPNGTKITVQSPALLHVPRSLSDQFSFSLAIFD